MMVLVVWSRSCLFFMLMRWGVARRRRVKTTVTTHHFKQSWPRPLRFFFEGGGGWMCNQYNFNIPRVIFSFPSHNIALPLSSLPPGCSQFLATLSIILWSYSRVMYELRADTGEVQRLESGSDIMWAVRHYYHLKSPVFFAILLRQLTSPKRFGDWVYVGFLFFAYPPPFESPWDEGGNARARGDVNSIANA